MVLVYVRDQEESCGSSSSSTLSYVGVSQFEGFVSNRDTPVMTFRNNLLSLLRLVG